jgi:PPOX class probable F420-dependent enzyme
MAPPAEWLRARVAAWPVARLGTVRADGTPHLVPCCFALDGDVVYSAVDAVKVKRSLRLRRLDNVRANPAACLLVDHYADDWSELWWVRLDGQGRVIESGPERDRAVELLRSKYRQYREQPPVGPVLALDITRWRAWPAASG